MCAHLACFLFKCYHTAWALCPVMDALLVSVTVVRSLGLSDSETEGKQQTVQVFY